MLNPIWSSDSMGVTVVCAIHYWMNPKDYKISQKPYDWLGHGLYFWENNYDRALDWATQKKHRGGIKEPAVVGAVLFWVIVATSWIKDILSF